MARQNVTWSFSYSSLREACWHFDMFLGIDDKPCALQQSSFEEKTIRS